MRNLQEVRWSPEEDVSIRRALERVMYDKRTISPELWTRRYVPYAAGDVEMVFHIDERLGSDELRSWTTNIVDQRPGFVMRRYGLDPDRPALPQLRPFKLKELDPDDDREDLGVRSGRRKGHEHFPTFTHYHVPGGEVRFDHPQPCGRPVAGRRCTKPVWHRATSPCKNVRKKVRTRSETLYIDEHKREQHDVVPPDGEPHDHFQDWKGHECNPARVAEHADGLDELRHLHERRAKYLYVPDDVPTIDVHPLAWPLLERGGPVLYFALEGLLKNDAILSTGAPVINAGSVTLWQDWEALRRLRPIFRRFETIVIVPDSDWAGANGLGNEEVEQHATNLADHLTKHHGARVLIAAPPPECGDGSDLCGHPKPIPEGAPCARAFYLKEREKRHLTDPAHKQGIDDALGPGGRLEGGNLLGMITLDRTQPVRPIVGSRRYDPTEDDDQRLVDLLVGRQTRHGRVRFSTHAVAEELGWSSHNAVRNALRRVEADGILARESAYQDAADEFEDDLEDRRRPGTVVRFRPEFLPHVEPRVLGDAL